MENTSRIALAAHIKAKGLKKYEFAAMLGVSAPQLSRWLSGTVIPARLSRNLVESVTGVSADGWQ